jgi:hypothetical protein
VHLFVVRLHQLIASNALHKAFLSCSATPRFDFDLLGHASGETRRPALTWILGDYFLDSLRSDEVRICTCIVYNEGLACDSGPDSVR